MIRGRGIIAAFVAAVLSAAAPPAAAQEVVNGPEGEIRVLDKITGAVRDVTIPERGRAEVGLLEIRLAECRYPAGNPAGNAYALLTIFYRGQADPVFEGWMIASSPALNPLDHPRYDVWPLRCSTS